MKVEVVGVTDGDTIIVLDGDKVQHKVRLAGIDAPERRQAFGARAQQALAAAVFRRFVVLDWKKRDRYGRLVAKVNLSDRDVGLELIAAGLAWHFKAYQGEQDPEDRTRYARAEIDARNARVGLWSDPHPTPPWVFRRSR
jgi:endonuclease YncB( thermonuclease family)